MKRRQFIVGLGAVSTGSALITGSGAFSRTEARRTASVDIVHDRDAYLGLSPVDNSYAVHRNDRLVLEFDDDFVGGGPTTGDGLGTDSVYRFDGVFDIKNEGSEAVRAFGDYAPLDDDDQLNNIRLYDTNDEDKSLITRESPSKEIGIGESILAGVELDTNGDDIGTFETSLKIAAKTPDQFD